MPLRKTRGKRQTKRGAAATNEEEEEHLLETNNGLEMAVERPDNLEEAKSTIERLARKYLHKSVREKKCAVDIVRVEAEELQRSRSERTGSTDTSTVFEFTAPNEGKENTEELRDSIIRQPSAKRLDTSSSQSRGKSRSRLRSKQSPATSRSKFDTTPIKRLTDMRRSLSSPEFKIPKPPLGHSTPGAMEETSRRNSYFGFETLESPLKLSPVSSRSYLECSPYKSPSPEAQSSKTFPHNRLVGTYDIPLHRPTPQQAKRKRQTKHVSGLAENLKKHFSEVDDFELVVE